LSTLLHAARSRLAPLARAPIAGDGSRSVPRRGRLAGKAALSARKVALTAGLFGLVATSALPARAADLHDGGVARIAVIQRALDEEQRPTRIWRWSWIGIYGGLAAGGIAGALLLHPEPGLQRTEHVLNAIGSALGAIGVALRPSPARHAADALRALPERTEEERQEKLQRAELLLAESAAAEAAFAGWPTQIGAVVVGAGLALPLWVKYDRPERAALSFFTTLAVTQIQIYTQPKTLIDLSARTKRPRLTLLPGPGSVMLAGWF
jgi:hypothetical protein